MKFIHVCVRGRDIKGEKIDFKREILFRKGMKMGSSGSRSGQATTKLFGMHCMPYSWPLTKSTPAVPLLDSKTNTKL